MLHIVDLIFHVGHNNQQLNSFLQSTGHFFTRNLLIICLNFSLKILFICMISPEFGSKLSDTEYSYQKQNALPYGTWPWYAGTTASCHLVLIFAASRDVIFYGYHFVTELMLLWHMMQTACYNECYKIFIFKCTFISTLYQIILMDSAIFLSFLETIPLRCCIQSILFVLLMSVSSLL